VARFAAEGKRCEHRRCRNPQTVNTWRYWRSAELGRVMLAEHQVCDEHGEEFASRHHITIGPSGVPRLFPGDLLAEFLERGEQRARLAAMTAGQLDGLAASGWHCGFPHCPYPARYLSSLRYAARNGQERQRGRFLCDRHAKRFAARHSIDFAAVTTLEEDAR
jgi:hypothetical protein